MLPNNVACLLGVSFAAHVSQLRVAPLTYLLHPKAFSIGKKSKFVGQVRRFDSSFPCTTCTSQLAATPILSMHVAISASLEL